MQIIIYWESTSKNDVRINNKFAKIYVYKTVWKLWTLKLRITLDKRLRLHPWRMVTNSKITGLMFIFWVLPMGHWMFNCSKVSQKVSESMDRVLPFRQLMMIRFHLLMCKYCTRCRNQLLVIRKAIRTEKDSDAETGPSESSFSEPAKRIKQAMRNQLKKKSG